MLLKPILFLNLVFNLEIQQLIDKNTTPDFQTTAIFLVNSAVWSFQLSFYIYLALWYEYSTFWFLSNQRSGFSLPTLPQKNLVMKLDYIKTIMFYKKNLHGHRYRVTQEQASNLQHHNLEQLFGIQELCNTLLTWKTKLFGIQELYNTLSACKTKLSGIQQLCNTLLIWKTKM